MLQTSVEINSNFSYILDYDLGICFIIGSGEANLKNVVSCIESILNNPEITKSLHLVADLTTISYHPTFDELMLFKNTIIALKRDYKHKIGIIAPSSIYTLAQLVSMLTQVSGVKMKTFRQYNAAVKWVHE